MEHLLYARKALCQALMTGACEIYNFPRVPFKKEKETGEINFNNTFL